MKQGYSKDGVVPFHFILLAFAGILVIFLLIGSLRNTCIKKRTTPDGLYLIHFIFAFYFLLIEIFSIKIRIHIRRCSSKEPQFFI